MLHKAKWLKASGNKHQKVVVIELWINAKDLNFEVGYGTPGIIYNM